MNDTERLTLFLDKQAEELAASLDWALKVLNRRGGVADPKDAQQYVTARRHLTVRQQYKAACERAA